MRPNPVTVPPALTAHLNRFFGPAWARGLPDLTARQLHRWRLRPTGAPMHGTAALVVPVRRPDDTPAVLKIQPVDEETRGEPDALRTWAGHGAVRLLDHDPATGALLLEALDPARTLAGLDITEALTTTGRLLARLHAHTAPPGLRTLTRATRDLTARATRARLRLRTPRDRDRLADLTARAREIAPDGGDRLLHWDLHYGNVLAPPPGADREPWLAIDPKPLAGHPGFDLLPALRNRWPEAAATGDPRRETRRRLDLLTETAGIDRERARAWTLVRVLQQYVWSIEEGATTLPRVPVTIASALTD
ncbi:MULTISPECIES: aminoglycoside phosphotransferase family protein [unclassified Nocardiopsis]|uniref:aminoglycoside phosphotransferase family protein n=1 Tax=unclassified Nocardiopsis TaxID=2649073 RepID=UPI00135B66EB|nr:MULTISPECIES: aminoglycoside phosphotransferase family protein [unclassified Nocardiopsis]